MPRRIDESKVKNRELYNLMMENGIHYPLTLARKLAEANLLPIKGNPHAKRKTQEYVEAEIDLKENISKKIGRHLYGETKIDSQYTVAYCKFFGCSADYLLGLIDRPTHEKTEIGGYTGLSDESIEKLHKYNTSHFSSERNYIQALDLILSCKNFEGVLERVLEYEKACHDVPVSRQELMGASAPSATRTIRAVVPDTNEIVTFPYVDVNKQYEKHHQYLNDISRKDALKYGIDTQFRKCLDEIE